MPSPRQPIALDDETTQESRCDQVSSGDDILVDELLASPATTQRQEPCSEIATQLETTIPPESDSNQRSPSPTQMPLSYCPLDVSHTSASESDPENVGSDDDEDDDDDDKPSQASPGVGRIETLGSCSFY